MVCKSHLNINLLKSIKCRQRLNLLLRLSESSSNPTSVSSTTRILLSSVSMRTAEARVSSAPFAWRLMGCTRTTTQSKSMSSWATALGRIVTIASAPIWTICCVESNSPTRSYSKCWQISTRTSATSSKSTYRRRMMCTWRRKRCCLRRIAWRLWEHASLTQWRSSTKLWTYWSVGCPPTWRSTRSRSRRTFGRWSTTWRI